MYAVWVFDDATGESAGVMHLPGVPREGDEIEHAGELCRVKRGNVRWGVLQSETSISVHVAPLTTAEKEWWK